MITPLPSWLMSRMCVTTGASVWMLPLPTARAAAGAASASAASAQSTGLAEGTRMRRAPTIADGSAQPLHHRRQLVVAAARHEALAQRGGRCTLPRRELAER